MISIEPKGDLDARHELPKALPRARHSENHVRHWLMLLSADRVNAVEGLLEDAQRSPRARVVIGSLFGAALLGGLTWMLRKR